MRPRALGVDRGGDDQFHPFLGGLGRSALLGEERPHRRDQLGQALVPHGAAREARSTHADLLPETGRLLADRLLALIQRDETPSIIEPAVAALREALAATDSHRITAETLRDLALRLPPAATTPDPLALAEEALALFVAMPMPGEEARCLEIMGDVLLARGRPEEAWPRYLTARAFSATAWACGCPCSTASSPPSTEPRPSPCHRSAAPIGAPGGPAGTCMLLE